MANCFKSTYTLVLLFLTSALFGQEFEFLRNSPSGAPTPSRKIRSIAIDSFDNLFIADGGTKSVHVYDQSGQEIEVIKSITTHSEKILLKNPTIVALDYHDNLYIYDEELASILVRSAKGPGFAFGDKVSGLGHLDNVLSIAVDSKGYCYVLNGSRKQIDVFSPQGNFITWIAGTSIPFDDPIALGMNGANELYVMEREGPTIYTFDVTCQLINTNRSLAKRKDISLAKPIDMAVLQNGDFLILDGSSNQATLFNKIGVVLGTVGSKGPSAKGVFQQATRITSSPSTLSLAMLDNSIQQTQVFHVKSPSFNLKPESKRFQMMEKKTSRPPAADLAVAPNGYRYVIPMTDSKKVIAYKDSSEKDIFTINGKLENAAAIAADTANNLFVVDRSADEILMFDDKGTLIRKFGQEISERLKDPVSIAIQKSGNIIVADRSRGSLYMWSSQGVFKKVITSSENSVIKSPVRIQVDSKDQIYVWDEDANCIYRIGSGGWPTSEKKIYVRGEKPGDKPGQIGGFFVDPLDLIHLYNKTTSQIEVYAFDFEPELKYSIGRPGMGINSFSEVGSMLLDKENLSIYVSDKKGTTQKVLQFLVPPPMPEGKITFDVTDGKLQIYFSKLKSPAVIAHGLLCELSKTDTILYRTTSSTLTVEPAVGDFSLHHYGFVSMSWSDCSDPSVVFDDYFTFGSQLILAGRYDEALGAWQLALEKMGNPSRMAEYIAMKLSAVSQDLIKINEVYKALAYIKYAFTLIPNSAEIQNNYGIVLKAYYRTLANRGDFNGIIVSINNFISNPTLKNLVLNTADSVSVVLGLEESLSSINNAISLQKRLIEWEKNPEYFRSLSATYLQLYTFKSIRDVSEMELKSILSEVVKYGQQAYSGLKQLNKSYFDAHLVLLEALNETGKYSDVEKQATSELGSAAASMSQQILIQYRKQLAIAFSGSQKFNSAEAEYNSILALTPDDIHASEDLVEVLIAEKKYDAAKDVLQQLMLGVSDNAAWIARIGYVELLKGNYPEAIFQLEKSIILKTSERENYGFLAEAYHLSSNNKKALDNYEVAVQFLDDILTSAGHGGSSEAEISELIARREKYLLVSAEINVEINDNISALNLFERLTEVSPANAPAWFGLGKSYLAAGRVYDAIEAYNKALSLDENNAAYISAFVSTMKLRDKALQHEPPLNILQIVVKDVYPSLYKNYSDLQQLPVAEIVIANNTADPIMPVMITTFIPDLMTQPSDVSSPSISAYSNQRLKLAAILPEKILLNNDKQTLQMEVVVTYMHKGKLETIKKTTAFVLNGRNAITWSDKRLLSSFVTPNEELLVEYNKTADVIFRGSASYGLNKPMIKALQTYTMLNESGVAYSADPAQSFSSVSLHSDILDYLQYPCETLKRKGGDCDDLVALFAGLLENGGVSTAYIDLPGHVMLAFDSQLTPQDLASNGIGAGEVIIVGERVWIPLETTLIGSKNFMLAWKAGAEKFYDELSAGHFPELIPFADAWNIYHPSSYVPTGFSEVPPSGKELLDTYDVMVSQLLSKTKREAISEMKVRYLTESNNIYVKNSYATLLAQTGSMQEAEKTYLEALNLSPDDASVLNNLGNVNYFNGKNAVAIEYYEQAAKSDDQDANILINLCRTNLAISNKDMARSWFEKAVALDPEINDIYTDLKSQIK